ncbi:MAG: efflux RND transporter periplasmic adaptor subunit [Gammaproteobacteria bacterium]|nr:efflux RND transporter periplasmic adaptor subunit [Gammaproteobacteria bacterium]
MLSVRTLLLLILVAVFPACSKTPPPPVVPNVSVQQPERRSIEVERDFIGEVAAVDEAEIRSKVNGRVLSVEFKEGSLVTQGHPLFRIDSESLQSAVNDANAVLDQAEANRKKAKADEERYKVLVENGTISRQQYDEAINRLEQANAAVESARAQLDQAETMLRESAILSPYNGRIGRAQVKVGALVTANQTLLATVSTTESVRVDFALSERDYLELVRPILESSQPRPVITVKLLLADGSLYKETGVITFADRTIASGTGTLAIAATFPNPREVLRPGMFGRVRAVVAKVDNALLIPNRAVQEVLDKTFISVIDKEGKVERREVKLGAKIGSDMQVISGLGESEQVIVDGHHKARPGAKVIAVPMNMAPLPAPDKNV